MLDYGIVPPPLDVMFHYGIVSLPLYDIDKLCYLPFSIDVMIDYGIVPLHLDVMLHYGIVSLLYVTFVDYYAANLILYMSCYTMISYLSSKGHEILW